MTFFSHRPYSLCFFISLLSEILYITYMAIFFKKSLYFRTRNLFTTHFLLSPHTSENTTSRNIGGTDAWAVPHLKFWGTVPQSSLSLWHISSGISCRAAVRMHQQMAYTEREKEEWISVTLS